MLDPERKESSGFDDDDLYAGTDSTVLDSTFVRNVLNSRQRQGAADQRLDAAIGIKNGLLIGAAFWAAIFFLLRILSP